MTACEKCLADSRDVEDYRRLLEERKDNPCTPEEQCGEMHSMIEWKDGSRHCACEKVNEASETKP